MTGDGNIVIISASKVRKDTKDRHFYSKYRPVYVSNIRTGISIVSIDQCMSLT